MEIKTKIKNFFSGLTKNNAQSVARLARVLGGIAVLLLVFQVGVSVGYSKADHAGRWGDTYYRTFGGGRMGMGGNAGIGSMGMGTNGDGRGMDAHGAAGKVVRIALPEIVISQPDGTEKSVVVDTNTVIHERRDTVTSDAIKVDGFIVVLGSPDAEGRVTAKLIRIMPMPLPGFPGAANKVNSTNNANETNR